MSNTQVDIDMVSAWLKQPRILTEKEKAVVDEIIKEYPYFLSAQWMAMGKDVADHDFSVAVLQKQKLYSGNWLLFYNTMQAAKTNELQAIAPLAEKAVPVDESTAVSEKQASDIAATETEEEELLVQPLYTENYFQYEGIKVSDEIPDEIPAVQSDELATETEDPKSLMVMMGFDEWLQFLKKKSEAKKSEEEDKAFLRSMWQREKLAAAIGEEDDNIPEAVFEMAINSIDKQDLMVSESLADIYAKQGRIEKAVEMYKKLSLQNPEKKTYFAAKIDQLNKENDL